MKWVTIFNPETVGVVEGVVLNPEHSNKLATWICNWDLFNGRRHSSAEEVEKDKRIYGDGNFCRDCRDRAALLMGECPYTDMTIPEDWEVVEKCFPRKSKERKPGGIRSRASRSLTFRYLVHMRTRVRLIDENIIFAVWARLDVFQKLFTCEFDPSIHLFT